MRSISLAAGILLVVAACGGGDPASTTEIDPPPPATPAGDEVATTETAVTTTATPTTPTSQGEESPGSLVIASIDFEAGIITVRNDGGSDHDLSGHWFCNRPSYAELPGEVLSPGQTIEIPAAGLNISAGSGELALYTSNSFGDPNSIIRYVQWGSDSHGRTSVAVDGGVWSDGEFVDNAGGNLVSSGSDPVGSADWSISD